MVIEQFLLRFVEPKLKLLKWLIGAKEKNHQSGSLWEIKLSTGTYYLNVKTWENEIPKSCLDLVVHRLAEKVVWMFLTNTELC